MIWIQCPAISVATLDPELAALLANTILFFYLRVML
jgi:hypothetical protein